MTYEFVGNTMVPTEVMLNDAEVATRYPGFRVAYMPKDVKDFDRIVNNGVVKKPFAIVTEGPTGQVVKELTETEAKDLNFLLGWLYEHDTQRVGEKELWERHKQAMRDANKEKKEATRQKMLEELEEAQSVYRSGKYTNKLSDGRIIREGVIEEPDRKTII